MSGFVALLADDPGGGRAAAVRAALAGAGWSLRPTSGLEIWTCGSGAPDVVEFEGGALIGDAFRRSRSLPEVTSQVDDPHIWARRLSAGVWGGFVALRRFDARVVALYRDPSGALAAHLVRAGGLTLGTSRLDAPGLRPLLRGCGVRRDAVARWLVDPCESATLPGLEGVDAAAPGGLLIAAGDAVSAASVWDPVVWAARADAAPTDAPELAARLRVGVQEAASAYLRLGRRLRVEVSGGLDSAVAAASFAAGGPLDPVHFHAPDPEADERRYARAVADRWGAELQEIDLEGDLVLDELPRFAAGASPSFNAVDRPYDLAVAEEARRHGAWGWVTGQGGDAAFLNLRAAALADGVVARGDWRAAFAPEVGELAAAMRTSVWRVVAAARRARSRPDLWPSWGPLAGTARELRDLRAGGSRHPWLRDLQRVEPAKRLQLVGLAFALLNNGDVGGPGRCGSSTCLCSSPCLRRCCPSRRRGSRRPDGTARWRGPLSPTGCRGSWRRGAAREISRPPTDDA